MIETFCKDRGYTIKGEPVSSTEGMLARAFMFGPGIDITVKCFKLERWAIMAEQWMRKARETGASCIPQVIERDERVLAYRYAPGVTLTQWAKQEPSEEHVVEVAFSCIGALWSLSRRGICHGDLHARNIIVDAALGASRVQIIDCQIARDALQDDCDEMIKAFVASGFISHHQGRDAGARNAASTNEDVSLRALPKVAAVLAGVSPTLRSASREARRRVSPTLASQPDTIF